MLGYGTPGVSKYSQETSATTLKENWTVAAGFRKPVPRRKRRGFRPLVRNCTEPSITSRATRYNRPAIRSASRQSSDCGLRRALELRAALPGCDSRDDCVQMARANPPGMQVGQMVTFRLIAWRTLPATRLEQSTETDFEN